MSEVASLVYLFCEIASDFHHTLTVISQKYYAINSETILWCNGIFGVIDYTP